MTEQETQELIQTYKNKFMSGGFKGINEDGMWRFLANLLARDLLAAKSEVSYMKTKIREMERLNEQRKDTARSAID